MLRTTATEAWLYIDKIFPLQIARWDLRHYIGLFRQEHLLDELSDRLDKLSATQDFKPLEILPQHKDGGVYVRFSYSPPPDGQSIEVALREEVEKHGPLPSWSGWSPGNIWLVKGSPWREDLNRFASPVIKVAFDGPDIKEESLYEICRPFGQINDLTIPTPVPAGSPRFSTVTYRRLHSATLARNVIHGLQVPSSNGTTRLRVSYEAPIQVHAVRDWMSSHPKIMFPIIVFLLGTLTYTIFDPIRSVMVEAKLLDWFDYKQFKLYQWLRVNTLDRFSPKHQPLPSRNVWKERKDAEADIQAYLSDLPSTIAFVHGPQGSGKTTMMQAILKSSGRSALIIDCRPLNNAPSDSQLVASLATQTGYWPHFTFLNSMNSLIDLASVGLIGQKSGLSASLNDQLQQVLTTVTKALEVVSSHHRAAIQRKIADAERRRQEHLQDMQKMEAIQEGIWHDGRLDCIAGNGIMAELGIGDERFDPAMDSTFVPQAKNLIGTEGRDALEEAQDREKEVWRKKAEEDLEAINSLPIVVIRNYAVSTGTANNDALLNALAQWAANLAEHQIAHVIVLSDNRENAKRLAKALPAKPLASIGLSDADVAGSLSFVKQRLHEGGVDANVSSRQTQNIERLGGRASDLESLIHKVRSGMTIDAAVEDIISRGVVELRKNAFGDDADDAKGLPWTREQAWRIITLLSKSSAIPYFDVLIEFPFKGEESALRSMEHAELISIGTLDGRSSTIRPGKPVFRWVFERLAKDPVFYATQELSYNEKHVADFEKKIKLYEDELHLLRDTMKNEQRPWWDWRKSPCQDRARYIGDKLVAAERKIEALERKNKDLKKIISNGDRA